MVHLIKIVRMFSVVLSFIVMNLLFFLVFSIFNYTVFEGEEMAGTLVTIYTLAFFAISLFTSYMLAGKIYLYLKGKKNGANIVFLIIVLTVFIGSSLFLNLSGYISTVE